MEGVDSSSVKSAIVLESVTKAFGSLLAVHDVSLVFEEGIVHSIIGPNGAGKTTLFNLISGNLRCTSGRLFFFGREITHLPPYGRSRWGLGRTFQITNLFQNLTVGQNILLGFGPKTLQFSTFRMADTRCTPGVSLLNQFGLGDLWNLPVKNLSYGEQRQIEVILGLATNPRVLLLDEPTAGLSPKETGQVIALIARIKVSTTIILVEHDFDVVFALSERVIVMQDGEIIAQGTKETIRADEKVKRAYYGMI